MKILIVAFLAAMAVQGAEFNVSDFGADEDAAPAANAAAIQRAIDAAARGVDAVSAGRAPQTRIPRGGTALATFHTKLTCNLRLAAYNIDSNN